MKPDVTDTQVLVAVGVVDGPLRQTRPSHVLVIGPPTVNVTVEVKRLVVVDLVYAARASISGCLSPCETEHHRSTKRFRVDGARAVRLVVSEVHTERQPVRNERAIDPAAEASLLVGRFIRSERVPRVQRFVPESEL